LLWLGGGLALLAFSVKKDLLDQLATFVGIAYAPSLLLLGAILLGFLLSMHFSVALSRLAEQNKRLAQELAILRLSVEEMRSDRRTMNADVHAARGGSGFSSFSNTSSVRRRRRRCSDTWSRSSLPTATR
jgi:hypothetical protein